jgi:hypothetical protein
MQPTSKKASRTAIYPGAVDTDGLADQATAEHVQQPVKRRGLSRLLTCCIKPSGTHRAMVCAFPAKAAPAATLQIIWLTTPSTIQL